MGLEEHQPYTPKDVLPTSQETLPTPEEIWSWFWWNHIDFGGATSILTAFDVEGKNVEAHQQVLAQQLQQDHPDLTISRHTRVDPLLFVNLLTQVVTPQELGTMATAINVYRLQPTQLAILMLETCCLRHEDIADRLKVSKKAIENHATHIYDKMRIFQESRSSGINQVSAVVRGIEQGLLPPRLVKVIAPDIQWHNLTRRETEVAHLLLSGTTNGEMANQLFISLKTPDKHLGNVYKKAGLKHEEANNHRLSVAIHIILTQLGFRPLAGPLSPAPHAPLVVSG